MATTDSNWVDNVIVNIMINDGKDSNFDEHEIITDFIMAIRNGSEDEWINKYNERLAKRKEDQGEWDKRWA